jgi:ketosteroid isomerase-like protein
MSDRKAILSAVENHYAMRNTEDPDKVMATLHPDCCHRIVGNERLAPFTQVNRGGDAIRKAVEDLVGQWDLSGLDLNIYVDDQRDTALVQRKGTVLHKPSGIKFETELIDKLTFKDGRIVEYDQFVDTHHVAKEMGMVP